MKLLLRLSGALLVALTAQVSAADMGGIATRYVQLVLTLGNHDPAYVDAYYGPADWAEQAKNDKASPGELASQAQSLRQQLGAIPDSGENEMTALRRHYLDVQLGALAAHAQSLDKGQRPDFQTQTKSLYDTNPPGAPLSSFDPILDAIADLVPGDGPLDERIEAFLKRFEIPDDKLSAVFDAAIAECRKRTEAYLTLPKGEDFTLEYVKDKPWSGYNWYQGKSQSLIQINTDLPVRIDRAVDLGCHEGYPGHHTYNAMLEAALVDGRGWVEFSVYPLFSPQSLIAEGSANYGIELAFPGEEKLAFEKAVLYPLAGLDPAAAQDYERVQVLKQRLSFARNEIARQYINGEIDRKQAVKLSQKYGPASAQRAEQSVRFIDTYGAYVINYNWGRELVKRYIEKDNADPAARWQRFGELLSSPRLPSSLSR